ncbi:MAG: SufD family Fe-S cluster assembly protein [Bacilli bacterium]|jgi:Fe-S cluster assembly protein SufD
MGNELHAFRVGTCQKQELTIDFEHGFNDLEFNVEEGATLLLHLLNLDHAQSGKITANVEQDGVFSAMMADFSSGKAHLEVIVNLRGNNARGTWKLSTLTNDHDDKIFNVFFNHLAPFTYGLMDNYGVARNSSRLIFSGSNEIMRGAHDSKTRQNAKIIVFDEGAIAKADPQLWINENEVEASHSAIVGKLNDDHLFYLMSRGLNLDEAKRLITYGYLMPIADYFADEEVKKRIAKIIEERV